jgi:hypothetical protein
VDTRLESFSKMQAELFRELKGPDADADYEPIEALSQEDPGEHMTRERMMAWARLALSDAGLPEIFVTVSPAVMEELREIFPDTEEILSLQGVPKNIPKFAETLAGYLSQVIRTGSESEALTIPAAKEAENRISLRIFRLGDISSNGFLNRLAGKEPFSSGDTGKTVLLILLELFDRNVVVSCSGNWPNM